MYAHNYYNQYFLITDTFTVLYYKKIKLCSKCINRFNKFIHNVFIFIKN